jgi:aminopeptidase
MNTLFYDILLDENAASHVAIGDAYKATVDEPDYGRINRSEIHLDFMIGGPGVDVTGLAADGTRVPVLRDGVWAI